MYKITATQTQNTTQSKIVEMAQAPVIPVIDLSLSDGSDDDGVICGVSLLGKRKMVAAPAPDVFKNLDLVYPGGAKKNTWKHTQEKLLTMRVDQTKPCGVV